MLCPMRWGGDVSILGRDLKLRRVTDSNGSAVPLLSSALRCVALCVATLCVANIQLMSSPHRCWGCDAAPAKGEVFQQCSTCKKAGRCNGFFCSRACLEANWPRHKAWHKTQAQTEAVQDGAATPASEAADPSLSSRLSRYGAKVQGLMTKAAEAQRLHDHRLAKCKFRRAAELAPGCADAHMELGRMHAVTADHVHAARAFIEAMRAMEAEAAAEDPEGKAEGGAEGGAEGSAPSPTRDALDDFMHSGKEAKPGGKEAKPGGKEAGGARFATAASHAFDALLRKECASEPRPDWWSCAGLGALSARLVSIGPDCMLPAGWVLVLRMRADVLAQLNSISGVEWAPRTPAVRARDLLEAGECYSCVARLLGELVGPTSREVQMCDGGHFPPLGACSGALGEVDPRHVDALVCQVLGLGQLVRRGVGAVRGARGSGGGAARGARGGASGGAVRRGRRAAVRRAHEAWGRARGRAWGRARGGGGGRRGDLAGQAVREAAVSAFIN